jgi:hypothetical protein
MKATSNKAWTIFFSPIWANLGLGTKKLALFRGHLLLILEKIALFRGH